MTTLGKILVIVNLVFSLVTAGLVIMVYSARTNWFDAYNKSVSVIKAAQANADAYHAEALEARKKGADDLKKVNDSLASANADVTRLTRDSAAMRTKYDEVDKLVRAAGVNVTAVTDELKRRADEINTLKTFVDVRDVKMLELERDKKDFRDRAVKAELDFKSEHDRNVNLLGQVENLTKEVARVQSAGTAVAGKPGTERRPPAEDVEGLVLDVDAQTGYMTLSIGSDAGINRGHTLEAYRLDPPTYLGTIQVLEVRPNQAVAKPFAQQRRGQIKAGDRVSSTILSKR